MFLSGANALRLHAVRRGTPGQRPLVLLHGVNQTLHSWKEFVAAAEETRQFDIVAFDQRGHGDSEHARDYSSAAMADDVEQASAQRSTVLCASCDPGV